MRKFAWSFSALKAFETCPYRFYLTRVSKEVTEPQGEHLVWGNEVHKAFEDYIKGVDRQYPDWFDKWRPIVDVVRKHGDSDEDVVIEAEKEVCIDEHLKPSSWWDKNVWCRGKIDLLVKRGDTAYLFDWKTGKRRPDFDQLRLFAALASVFYPDVKHFVCTFVWLKPEEMDTKVFTREDLPEIWSDFLARVGRMKQAYETNNWPANPSGLCRNWCPVPKSKCTHSGKEG